LKDHFEKVSGLEVKEFDAPKAESAAKPKKRAAKKEA
jgi:hypothetical protein